MKILYVARHDQPNADDEGAITHALEQLGHHVTRVEESRAYKLYRLSADLCLFHHWKDTQCLSRVECPKVFWFFDLVDWPGDESLVPRCDARKAWMHRIIPEVHLGFCTDGDWVKLWNTSHSSHAKLIWLPQGADQRLLRRYRPERVPPILFTGIGAGGGVDRFSFVAHMKQWYGEDFYHISHGLYRDRLGAVVAGAEIVVCPDSPVTHDYWSNRVYTALGFGAFVLHPYARNLSQQYQGNKELAFYFSRQHLKEQIDFYRSRPALRKQIADAGLEATKKSHTYRHRVEKLLSVVKERLGVG